MPTVQLNNRTAKVTVHHSEFDNTEPNNRSTTVVMETSDGFRTTATAIVHPKDRFVKSMGRLVAARKLNDKLRENGFDRKDRGTIFRAIYK